MSRSLGSLSILNLFFGSLYLSLSLLLVIAIYGIVEMYAYDLYSFFFFFPFLFLK